MTKEDRQAAARQRFEEYKAANMQRMDDAKRVAKREASGPPEGESSKAKEARARAKGEWDDGELYL